MAANVQWDVFANDHGQQVVRMLLNEREVPFGGTCRAIGDGSVFYTVPELKRCLTGASVPDDSWQVTTPQQSGTPTPEPGDNTPNSQVTQTPSAQATGTPTSSPSPSSEATSTSAASASASSPAPASPDSRGGAVDGSSVPGARNAIPDTVSGSVPGSVDGGRPGLPRTGD